MGAVTKKNTPDIKPDKNIKINNIDHIANRPILEKVGPICFI